VRGKFWSDRDLLWKRAKVLDRTGVQLLAVLKSIGYAEEQEIKHTGKVIVEHVSDWRNRQD
jgi:hypothetical protein